ncbi:DUF58 domain-containing protein [Candidatus Woesearchaeota archaeon]|jgi:uncharacterized protein (DUF58 family)|nr:DUF58 domain-containing protein [Candidatus Woesearchaeota archaeon]MBT6520251.1 DUF58 domain-containing protein [Candidatus Woesearchaeota archaeon]MBT7368019.1 DUF58 domain-containing protein [Candidatus Woesearchaeota archaeon]
MEMVTYIKMIELDFLRQLDKFRMILKKRIHSNYSGSRQSKKFGSGLVFYDYRKYDPGDDFRAIDWKIYAKTGNLFIKRFEEERNMRVHVILDASASMDYGEKTKKFDYASKIGLGFSYMALKNNERFEVSTFSDELNVFRAHKGMSKLVSSLYTLGKIKLKGHSNFADSIEQYKSVIKTKSMIVIISDFLFDIEELKRVLPRFKKSEVILVQILDKDEIQPLLEGDVLLIDSETQAKYRTFISHRFKENYSKELMNHIHQVKELCESLNLKFVSVSTDTPIFDAFYEILAR